ncbi:MAG: hypothetical protein M1814_003686 [Vezdaea aestivalis]|nr:MAG: hypothetical protein M1814_003686 [Vezdaea aestivalis]
MPSPFPSSFASAAAGTPAHEAGPTNGRAGRPDGSGSGDWSRSRTNGTATFSLRRPSLATSAAQQTPPPNAHNSSSNVYVPPHQLHSSASRNGLASDSRYSKEQMLSIFRAQKDSGELGKNVSSLFIANWDPSRPAEQQGNPWGKREESHRDSGHGSEICWDSSGATFPLGLMEMTAEERDLLSTSVNSPLKPPPQAGNKEGQPAQASQPGRKVSLSGAQSNQHNYGLTSPTSARPSARRRDTSEGNIPSSITSPTRSKFLRDEANPQNSPPTLSRRRTDVRDGAEERDKDGPNDYSPFGSLSRRSTGVASSNVLNGPSSPWSNAPQSATFSPMGAFGSFMPGSSTAGAPGDKTKAYGSLRGESRFSKMMTKDSGEDLRAPREKSSFGNLTRLSEAQEDANPDAWRSQNRMSRGMSSATDPFGDEERMAGGGNMASYGQSGPNSQGNNFALSDFGMSSAEASMPSDQIRRQNRQDSISGQEPYSPTMTNPYTSPAAEKEDLDDIDTDGSEVRNTNHPGLVGIAANHTIGGPFTSFPRNIVTSNEADRSQTSSAGPTRNSSNLASLGGLAGLGGMSGWAPNPIGTPDRERPAHAGPFGNSMFGNMGDLQSPSASSMPYSAGSTIGRGSRLGSLFPPAMQAQMQSGEGSHIDTERSGDGIGQSFSARQTDSPLRANRGGMFDDLNYHSIDTGRGAQLSDSTIGRVDQPGSSTGKTGQTPISSSGSQDFQQSGTANMQSSHQGQSNQPPQNQPKMMVMPDRMRWIYRDPQGNTQGPWSGLEMHDWYKAGFFTPDLMVRKMEDVEYEPLGQLIRRIGNSREPFLVPQMGVPHGPSNGPQASNWNVPGNTAMPGQGSAPSGTVQPPFAGSFPTFGTTLTAEQQNNLERRKQEEQYLMARQKEYLAQQQVLAKHHGMPMHSGHLNHHSSANSLQSQPSFGSITSPGGFQATPPQPPIPTQQSVPPFLDTQHLRQVGSMGQLGPLETMSAGGLREEEIAAMLGRMNMGRDSQQAPFQQSGFNQVDSQAHAQQVASLMAQRNQLQREQAQQQASGKADGPDFQERLQQFNNLRSTESLRAGMDMYTAQKEAEMRSAQTLEHTQPLAQQNLHQQSQQGFQDRQLSQMPSNHQEHLLPQTQLQQEPLSLAQQVQNAASAKRGPSSSSQPQSPWGKIEQSGLPHPFPPPPQSNSPLPAPSAQRTRQNLTETLQAETLNRSDSPLDTPLTSVAPWAREASEGSKGPSLKEIQEAEARKAAKAEEAAAALRRQALEQERLNQPPPPVAGLPLTATWGSTSSPTGAAVASAWNKPGPKPSSNVDANKKSLSQIQKEEEARKQRAANVAAQSHLASVVTGGKRYAELASKTALPVAAPGAAPAGSGWTTVGTGGAKPKGPAGPSPVATAPPGFRPASSNVANVVTTGAGKTRQVASFPVTKALPPGMQLPAQPPTPLASRTAKEEVVRWARRELTGKMKADINVDNFVQQLMIFPADLDIIKESVHAHSDTIHAHHFAEEFIRRRAKADKGITISAGETSSTPTAAGASTVSSQEPKGDAGGWSAVARKASSNPKQEEAAFKVVSKKKGRK